MHPIHAGMKIETKGTNLIFTGSDGWVTFSTIASAQFKDDVTVTVPGKLLADVAKTLPDKDVHFITEDHVATLTCGKIQFRFPIYKEEYPQIPDPAEPVGQVDAEPFQEAIRKVIPAASRGDTNPTLSAVYLEPADHTLWAVCTDRYRLAAVQVPWVPADMVKAALLPSQAAEKFTRNVSGPITLGWDDKVVSMDADGILVTSRVLTGEFPAQWRNLLPQVPCTVEVSTEDLLNALKRASLAAEVNSPVELTFTAGRLHVEAGFGNHADDVLDCSYNGDEFRVLFGIGYLTDGLAGCDATARFGWTDPLKPVYVESGEYTYTILPRRQI